MPRRRVSHPLIPKACFRITLSSASPRMFELDGNGRIVRVRPCAEDSYWLGRVVANVSQLLWWHHERPDRRPAITQMPLAIAIHSVPGEIRLVQSAYIIGFEIL